MQSDGVPDSRLQDVVVGHVAIGFDNGYVLIYKERMASYSAESLRDKNSYSFHCILGPTDSTRKGDPVKAIDLANDEHANKG